MLKHVAESKLAKVQKMLAYIGRTGPANNGCPKHKRNRGGPINRAKRIASLTSRAELLNNRLRGIV